VLGQKPKTWSFQASGQCFTKTPCATFETIL
jgi:hypothetical protein